MTLGALRARLDESLFLAEPRAVAAAHDGGRGKEAALVAACFVLGILLQLVRPGWSSSLDSLWAEDGPIFLQGALTQGFADAVFTPYAGYLVLIPRLIGEGAALLPLGDAAATVAILSAATVSLSGIVVWYASASHIQSPYLRAALAAATVLAPVAGLESVDSAAYVPWYMLFATFWLLLWRPATTLGAMLAALFVLATALSSPGVWFFAPVAALRALVVRDTRDAAIVAAFGAGAIAQIPVIALNQAEAVEPLWTDQIWTAYAQRVVDGAAFGLRLGGAAWAHLGWAFLGLLLAGGLVALAVGMRRANSSVRWLAALSIPISLALFVLSAYQRAVGDQIVWPQGNYHAAAGRYAIVPALLLLGVALAAIDRSDLRRRGRLMLSWLGVAAVGMVALTIATSFDVSDSAVRGEPPWDDSLRAAATECAAKRVPNAEIATSPPGFLMTLPCEQVADFASRRP